MSFDLIADYKKYSFVPKSTLRAMVFVAIWPAGRSDLVILPSGFKPNSATCIENYLKPLLASLPPYQNLKKIIFHQDHAPGHLIRKAYPFLEEILPLFVRADETSHNSPDPNPLDYSLWRILKEKLHKYDLVPNFEWLAEILQKEWASIPQQVIRDSCKSWLRRVRRVERTNGYYILIY